MRTSAEYYEYSGASRARSSSRASRSDLRSISGVGRRAGEPRVTSGRIAVQRHHQRSLSAVSILAGPAPYNAPVFISPPRSAHAPRPSLPVSIAPAALVRPLHSNLHANTFAFAPGAAGDIPPSVYDGLASRASTSELHSPRASSPEFDDEYDFGHDSDDDSGEYSLGQYYASAGAGGMGYGVEVKAAMDGVPGASRSNALAWTGRRAMLHEPHVAVHGGWYVAQERGAAGVQGRGRAHFLRVSPADVFQP
ncbi:hypothetical protein A0H81_09258 [Grifola frondosa]|uniref:Uncharacterized protein n=1 Tax=Grifola frondosa TaxID=5627 RepID=A0A1C7M2F0_GRIFR|nr:hypothetical protein A0H81_09258 [Grifola frondosa]